MLLDSLKEFLVKVLGEYVKQVNSFDASIDELFEVLKRVLLHQLQLVLFSLWQLEYWLSYLKKIRNFEELFLQFHIDRIILSTQVKILLIYKF